jgi:3-oxoacyl-[acyl-carrier-protein] synthase-3
MTSRDSAPPRRWLAGPEAVIAATGLALPATRVDNATLLARLAPQLTGARRDAMLAQIEAQLGSLARHHLDPALPDEGRDALVHLSARAARDAIAALGPRFDPSSISFHVHATSTPSRWTTPESARIGMALADVLTSETAFFDVRAGCTGGLHALWQAARLASDSAAPVLVTCADRFSRTAPPTERFAAFAFGDGAAAAVVLPGSGPGYRIERATFGGIARHADLATVHAELPPAPDDPPERWYLGGDPIAFDAAAREALGALAASFEHHYPGDAAPLIVSTSRVSTARALGGDRAFTAALESFAHLGTASLLAALHTLLARPETPPAALTLLAAGGGLSFGGARLVRTATIGGAA